MGEDDYSWLFDGLSDNGLTNADNAELWDLAGQGLDPSGNGVGDAGFDWSSDVGQAILNGGISGGGGGGGSSSGGFDISKLLGSLGGGQGLGSLYPLLAGALALGGGLMNRNATQHATDQTVNAMREANDRVTGILGGTNTAFKPYTDMGAQATQQLSALPQSNIAGQFGPIAQNFGPLGTGRGIKLGALLGR